MQILSKMRYAWLIAAAMACFAAAQGQQTREAIQKSMKQRYPALQELKKAGKVGETYSGYVAAVTEKAKADEDVSSLIARENQDRKALYALIAEETSTTAEAVGKINARRVFDKAEGDTYFQSPDGQWARKKNIKDGYWRLEVEEEK